MKLLSSLPFSQANPKQPEAVKENLQTVYPREGNVAALLNN